MRVDATSAIEAAGPPHAPAPANRAAEVLLNSPARALIYGLIALEPDRDHTPADLTRRLNMRQGPSPGWKLRTDCSDIPGKFCESSLVQAGLVAQTTTIGHGGKAARSFRAVPEHIDENLAYVGIGADWELQFPHLRLNDLLGDSRLHTGQAMPVNNLMLYNALLRSPNGRASRTELLTRTGLPRVFRSLGYLERTGCIEKSSTYNFNEREIILPPPPKNYFQRHGDKLSGIGKAVYSAAQALRRRGSSRVSGADLLAEIAEVNSELALSDVRRFLTSQNPPFIKYPNTGVSSRKRTAYSIKAELRPAIADLLLRIDNLESDPEFALAAARRAAEIISNRGDMAFLMAKAKPSKEAWRYDPASENLDTRTRRRLASLTLQRLPIAPDWGMKAACRGRTGTVFVPDEDSVYTAAQAREAKAVCGGCEVVYSCLQTSLDNNEKSGVFGGMGIVERRAYRLSKPKVLELQKPTRT